MKHFTILIVSVLLSMTSHAFSWTNDDFMELAQTLESGLLDGTEFVGAEFDYHYAEILVGDEFLVESTETCDVLTGEATFERFYNEFSDRVSQEDEAAKNWGTTVFKDSEYYYCNFNKKNEWVTVIISRNHPINKFAVIRGFNMSDTVTFP